MLSERWGRLFCDHRFVHRVFWQNAAGQIEVVERLLAGHPGTLRKNELRLRLNLSDLPLGIQPGPALGSRYTLQIPRMSQFGSIRCKPSFTVSRGVDACGRYADKQHQEQ
jgi:hypothetical protein